MINNNWIFGNNCGLDFTNSPAPPTGTSGFAITTLEGCASVSDINGNLRLYTDGSTIWNGSHAPIATSLDGNSSSTQSAIIVPNPGNNQEYYVFTADGASGTNNHFNGGLVDASDTFTPLASLMTMPSVAGFSPVEKVTAIQHANCEDFWVMTLVQKGSIGTANGAGFLRLFLVTATGVQHISDTSLNVTTTDYGYMKGSSNGARIGIANLLDNEVYVFPFDNAAGTVQVGGLQTITAVTSNNYGLEFSPDSNLLYFSEYPTGKIFQVDLSGLLVPNLVGTIDGQCGALQIGRDGIIYIAEPSKSSVGAILDPNVIGNGCNVTNAYVALALGSSCQYGLPNLIANVCGDDECGCGCNGCDKEATEHNDELIERAKEKFNTLKSPVKCADSFMEHCDKSAIDSAINFKPCFYFHWGDGAKDQIESHDTEVFYLTVCNHFKDIQYNGLRITKVKLVPNNLALDELQIVPDVLVNFDCLTPCSCQTREFAMITRSKDTVGKYDLEVEYCYEEIVIASSGSAGMASFPVEITKD